MSNHIDPIEPSNKRADDKSFVEIEESNRVKNSDRKLRVFISYKQNAEPDEAIALEVYRALNKQYEVFIDQVLIVGARWAERIEYELRQADFLIALLSEESVESEMVRGEIETAHRLAKERDGHPIILPVRLAYREPFKYPFSAYLNHINWAFWQGPDDTPRLVSELAQAVSGAPLTFGSSQKEYLLEAEAPHKIPYPSASARPPQPKPFFVKHSVRIAPHLKAPTLEEDAQSRPNNLPVYPTSLIGREAEMAAIEKLLRQREIRLLTLTGPGGAGKTRLALEVAATLISDFDDGVYFISLAAIIDPSLVASEICRVLRVEKVKGLPLIESLKHYLRSKKMLLLLDNFDQLVPAIPSLAELLAACPRLKLLVTSRSALRLRGEREFAVPPLALPDLKRLPPIESLKDCPAVALFIERAQASKTDFALTAENAIAVAEICTRLDGLPLAIELAAAHIKVLSPKEMLARLVHRLKLLISGARDLPPRQRTMRSAIAYSYDLLEEIEKRVFRWLAVFVGGFTFEAVEQLCQKVGPSDANVLETLSSLLDNSLLRHEEQTDGGSRFLMLETIREYGLECLAESREVETVQRAHATIFLELVTSAEQELRGPDQALWLDRLEVEHDNLRAALRWSKESGQIALGLRMAASLWRFWEVRGYLTEGREDLDRLLALARTSEGLISERANALYAAGSLARSQADYTSAEKLLEEGLALYRQTKDDKGVASSLNCLGVVAWYQNDYDKARGLLEEGLCLYRKLEDRHGIAASLTVLGVVSLKLSDYEEAIAFQEESISIRRELGDKLGTASSLNDLGVVALDRADYKRAAKLFAESLTLFRQLGDRLGIATSLNNLGEVAQHQGDYNRAAALYNESLTIFRELGDKRDIATLLTNLGDVSLYQGDNEKAAALYTESLTLLQEVGERLSMAFCFEGLAAVACAFGQAERSAQLFGVAEALREAVGAALPPARLDGHRKAVSATRDALDDDTFAAIWLKGREMKLEQAVAYALSALAKA